MRLHYENLDWISIMILGHGYIYLKSAGDAPKEEDFPPNTELKSDFGSLGWETLHRIVTRINL